MTIAHRSPERAFARTRVEAVWRVAGVVAAAAILALGTELGLRGTAVAWAIWLVVLTVRTSSRIPAVVFGCLSAYATVAWLAASHGQRVFPPFPTIGVIESVTFTDLRSVVAAYLVIEATVGTARLAGVVRSTALRSRDSLLQLGGVFPVRVLVLLVLIAVGVADWVRLAGVGVAEVFQAPRRQYGREVLLGSDHNVQIIVIALTVVAGVWAVWDARRSEALVALVVCWSPFVLAGNRKELLIAAAAIGLILATAHARRALVGCSVVAVALFVQPMLKTGDVFDSLHEFILPQYMHFAVAMNLAPDDFGGPFFARAAFLLPAPLRGAEPVNLARAFLDLGVTEVGVGSSPFAEAAMLDPRLPAEVLFAALFAALVGCLLVAAKPFPVLAVIVFAHLLILGRSDFWISVFFIVYSGLVLEILVRIGRRRTPFRDVLNHPQNRQAPLGTP